MAVQPALLVTGAAGFIGSRFVESCKSKAIPVVSVDKTSHFNARPEHRGLDYGTLVDRDALWAWLTKNKPYLKAIVHLGARTDTTETDEALLKKQNVDFSKTLWTYSVEKRIPFYYASSAATYGDGSQGYDDDPKILPNLKALNPYGESKRVFDNWIMEQVARGSSPPAWAGFKFFNVYGYGERHKGKMASVVLHAFDQIQTSGQAKLFKSHKAGIADGHQKRDFIFVDDVLSVLHFAIKKPITKGIYNLGTGQARTFLDLTKAVFASMGKPEKIQFIDTPANIRDKYQYFTEAKMERLREQGFAPQFTSLEDGVQKYIQRLSQKQA